MENTDSKNILVTGGTGYIGVHTIVSLLESGYDVTVVDSLHNSSPEGLKKALEITKVDVRFTPNRLKFFQCDMLDEKAFEEIFRQCPKFHACIHFAALKAVGESVQKPLLYYENNIGCTLVLLKLMEKYQCRSFIFSSSATVYGAAEVPITEESQVGVGITNPYGRTKYFIEEILKDYKKACDLQKDSSINQEPFSLLILRYFNPIGAHPSGLIGEDPNGIPNNLMPYIAQVVVGRREKLMIFGNDYPTKDGTGVRDYIHVMDLAEGHVAGLKYVEKAKSGYGQTSIFNLGTGQGYSVLEMIQGMNKASGKTIPYEFAPRREGDIAVCYADCSKAERELGWKATRGIDEMCRDLWNWQSNNPNGYASATATSAVSASAPAPMAAPVAATNSTAATTTSADHFKEVNAAAATTTTATTSTTSIITADKPKEISAAPAASAASATPDINGSLPTADSTSYRLDKQDLAKIAEPQNNFKENLAKFKTMDASHHSDTSKENENHFKDNLNKFKSMDASHHQQAATSDNQENVNNTNLNNNNTQTMQQGEVNKDANEKPGIIDRVKDALNINPAK